MKSLTININRMRKAYQSSIQSKLIYWAVIALLSLILAFLMDIFYFQLFHFNRNTLDYHDIEIEYANLVQNEDGSLTGISDPALIVYKFPESYVYKLRFKTKTEKDERVDYTITCLGAALIDEETLYNSFGTGTETLFIDAVTEEVRINLYKSANKTFNFDLVEIDYVYGPNPIRILALFVSFLLVAYAVLLVLRFIPFRFTQIALVYSLGVGILLAFIVPPIYSYDEFAHLTKILNLTYGRFHTEFTRYQLYPEGFTELNTLDYRSYEEYRRIVDHMAELSTYNYNLELLKGNAGSAFSYGFIPYIFSAVGMGLARIFKVNVFYYPFFSRLGNVIFYSICLYYALKLFKSNRPFLFYFALSPMMLYLSASAGTSAVLNGSLILAFAYITYLMTEKEKITILNYLFLLVLFLLITVSRMPSGIFTLLLLLLPSEKMRSSVLRRTNKIITIALTVIMMAGVYFYTSSISLASITVTGVNPEEQIAFILANPIRFMAILLKYSATNLIGQGLLDDLGYLVYNGWITSIFVFFGVILFIYLSLAGNRYDLPLNNTNSRILIWLTFMICIAIGEAALYITFTPVGSDTVLGYQSRYLISTLFLPFLTVQTKTFYLKYKKSILNNIVACYSLLLLLISVGTVITKFYR